MAFENSLSLKSDTGMLTDPCEPFAVVYICREKSWFGSYELIDKSKFRRRSKFYRPLYIPGLSKFISVGEDSRFCKRLVNQYPARPSGGLQSPTEINALLGCAGIRFGIMSASANPNSAPSLANET